MEIAAVQILGSALVLAALVPPYVIGRNRLTRAYGHIAQDPEAYAGFTGARGGARPVAIYLIAVVFVVVVGLGLQHLFTIQAEPKATDAGVYTILSAVLFAGAPIVLALILVAMLISLAATGRAKSRALDELAERRPDLPGLAEAAELLQGGRSRAGVAGTAAVASLACLVLGIGWIALLFSAASYAITCARSSKCL